MTKLDRFLGLAHDLRSVATLGVVKFWPRDGLVAELQQILTSLVQYRICTGCFAKGLGTFKQYQICIG